MTDTILRLALTLVDRTTRQEGAGRLTSVAGATALFALIEDAELGVLVPAPGFTPTLPGGRHWRTMLTACQRPGLHVGAVPAAHTGEPVAAMACAAPGVALIFVGEHTDRAVVEQITALLPALGSAWRAEHEVAIVRAALHVEQEGARSAEALAQTLDRTRADLEVKARSLEEARIKAEDATRAKDTFLAMLGHELRNPLAPIVTALHLMRMRGVQSRELEIIERHVTHLRRLVDDLLDVARITQGKIDLHRREVEVSEVVALAVEMVSPALEQRRQTLVVDVPKAGLLLAADPPRLAQVIANLLTNASRYSPFESRVRVTAARQDDRIAIHVIDQGSGIEPDILKHVFDTFVQGPRAIDEIGRGLGIGLTVVRSLVSLHGGTVRALSEGKDRGTEVIVDLPASPTTAAAAATPGREDTVPNGEALVPRRPRVLLVDDNEDGLEMLAHVLDSLGYEVRTASDGPAALECARQFHPAIALLDIGLPVMDGYELAQRLLSHGDSAPQRLIAITGYGQDVDRARSRAAGFHAHLVKPVDFGLLKRVLEQQGEALDVAGPRGVA